MIICDLQLFFNHFLLKLSLIILCLLIENDFFKCSFFNNSNIYVNNRCYAPGKYNGHPQIFLKRIKSIIEMPIFGLCFAGGEPVVVKQAKNKTLFERSEFCFVPLASHRRVAEKLSLDFLVLFYQEKGTMLNIFDEDIF